MKRKMKNTRMTVNTRGRRNVLERRIAKHRGLIVGNGKVGKQVGAVAGQKLGSAAGASIGTSLGGPVGGYVGSALGGAVGKFAGKKLGSFAEDKTKKLLKSRKTKRFFRKSGRKIKKKLFK